MSQILNNRGFGFDKFAPTKSLLKKIQITSLLKMASAEQIQEYNKLWDEAVSKAFDAYNGSGWSQQKSNDPAIEIFTRTVSGSGFAQVKSVATVAAPIDKVFEHLKTSKTIDQNTPKEEREGNIERRILSTVEGDPNNAGFFYINIEASSRLVSPRDFLMYQKMGERDGSKFLVRTSIDNQEMRPTANGSVRANMFFQCFICEKVDDNNTKLTFICHADPAGSIPAMVYNFAATNQGYSVLRMKKEIEA